MSFTQKLHVAIHDILILWDASVKLFQPKNKKPYLITVSVSDLVSTFVQGIGSCWIIDVEMSSVVVNVVLERGEKKRKWNLGTTQSILHQVSLTVIHLLFTTESESARPHLHRFKRNGADILNSSQQPLLVIFLSMRYLSSKRYNYIVKQGLSKNMRPVGTILIHTVTLYQPDWFFPPPPLLPPLKPPPFPPLPCLPSLSKRPFPPLRKGLPYGLLKWTI